MTNGVVQQVDANTGTVALKHQDTTNMNIPAMTMAFTVADKKMLDSVKPGDKVKCGRRREHLDCPPCGALFDSR